MPMNLDMPLLWISERESIRKKRKARDSPPGTSDKSNETLGADVCLAPNSGARADIPGPPLWANSGLMHRSKV
jgi:hypothetical protein